MSSDPYGYEEQSPPAPADLSRVLWYGVGALLCAAVGPCLCYLPYLAAIPLGWMAIQGSKAARSSAVPLERTVGSVAQTSGAVGLGFGVLAILGVTLYGLFLGGAIALGALGDTFDEPDAVVVEPTPVEEPFVELPNANGFPPAEGSPGVEGGVIGGQEAPTPDVLTPPPDMPQE